eukprot:5723715-Amphidinium_carterae.2
MSSPGWDGSVCAAEAARFNTQMRTSLTGIKIVEEAAKARAACKSRDVCTSNQDPKRTDNSIN